ncbi:hypothetical protein, partial [Neorhizobium sp. DT-125]|uniref:hypothetical protein n=1 Tax=Neorhizobium sp. DT-125 TaxID=3396163 RepID=UPI003F1C117C
QHPPTSLGGLRTKDFVASSAAALVSDTAYRGTLHSKSTGLFKKMSFFVRTAKPASKADRKWA